MKDYRFQVYSATPEGIVSHDPVEDFVMPCFSEGSAITLARKLARQHQAPIDVMVVGVSPFGDRALGTAIPKYPHSSCKITEFERADG